MKKVLLLTFVLIFGCNMDKREKLIQKIYSLGYPENEIVVSLQDFFEGNTDEYSICPNIYNQRPTLKEFYLKLIELKNRDDVEEVLVRIQDVDNLEWPFTDTIYIISKMSLDELKNELIYLKPDEIYQEWMYGKPVNYQKVKEGYFVYSIWWD